MLVCWIKVDLQMLLVIFKDDSRVVICNLMLLYLILTFPNPSPSSFCGSDRNLIKPSKVMTRNLKSVGLPERTETEPRVEYLFRSLELNFK